MKIRIKLALLVVFGSICTASAQQQYYDWRIGAGVGGTYFLGDLSNGLNRNAFSAPAYQVMLGRTISPSFGVELNGTWATLTGNDRTRNWRGNLQLNNPNFNRGLNFETTVRSASLLVMYRFNNGVLLSRYARFAPYVFAGAGITDFRVNSDLLAADGQPYFYWPDNTIRNQPEGTPDAQIIEQDGNFETRVSKTEMGTDYPTQVATLPFGAGLQVRLADRLSANVRAEARYAFTDYLDNTSTGSNRNDVFFLGTVSLQYHFNWGKRKPFKAPTVYVGYEQPSMAMARQTPANNSTATASGNTPGRDMEDISRIPASQKGEVSRIQPSPGVSAPDRLPGRQDQHQAMPDSSRSNTLQRETSVLESENYGSHFQLRRPAAANDQMYTGPSYTGNQPQVENQPDPQNRPSGGDQSRPAGGQNLQPDNQINELRRRQEENNAAIRRSEAELDRLKMQVRESPAPRTSSQEDTLQESGLSQLSNEEKMRSVALNNRLTGLENDLQRLRRENEAYQRQLRRLTQGAAADDLITTKATLNQNRGPQVIAGASPETKAQLDSLTGMVKDMQARLNASGNSGPVADTLPVRAAGEPRNVQPLTSSPDQLKDQELDSLHNQLGELRKMMASLENQLAEKNNTPASRKIAPYGSLVVYYPLNSAVIGEADKRRLDLLTERVKANPSALIRLNGHTDNTGNADHNLRLSHKRAETIRDYLLSASGIPADRVIINYYGQQQATGGGKNPYARKVEIELYIGGNGNQD
jgi:outer membrane protein OmpA-like peptidoglycan-associated protein